MSFSTMIWIKICQPLEAKLTNLKLSKMVFHVVFLCQKCAKVQFWAFDSPKVEKTRGNHNGPLPLRRKFYFWIGIFTNKSFTGSILWSYYMWIPQLKSFVWSTTCFNMQPWIFVDQNFDVVCTLHYSRKGLLKREAFWSN